MCVMTDNTDMAVDVLDRVSRVMSFIEEVLVDGRKPEEGLTLSAEALDGLVIIAKGVNHAVHHARDMK